MMRITEVELLIVALVEVGVKVREFVMLTDLESET